MPRDIVIFGAGGLARELAEWIRRDPAMRVHALVSDVATELAPHDALPVIDRAGVDALLDCPSYVMGIADTTAKRRIAGELESRGWRPVSWIDPSAIVAASAILGAGVVVCPFCTVSPGSVLGDLVLLNVGCGVGHDARIGSFSSLLGRVSINGHVRVGENVLIGAGATIVPGRAIGDGATIGMGSVVIANVRGGTSVFGNPARRIES